MILPEISPETLKMLLWVVALMIVDYAAVLVAVLIDLRSGMLKTRRRGEPRTSKGYRRTVDKASRYFITLLALSVIDSMVVMAAMLLRSTMAWNVPALPVFTTIGAICLTLIEAKSVVENTQKRSEYTDAADALTGLLSEPAVKRLMDALKELSALRGGGNG